HSAREDEEFSIGVSGAADVVGVFNARVWYQYLTADPIGQSMCNWQHYASCCHGNRQQRRKQGAWLHPYPIGLKVSQCPAYSSDVVKFVTAAERCALESIEYDDFASKLN